MIKLFNFKRNSVLERLISLKPSLKAIINGNEANPHLQGKVYFYQVKDGVYVVYEIVGLPKNDSGFFAMHIHDIDNCDKNNGEYENSNHYNPTNESHPLHSGDFPNILSNNGYSFGAFFTNRINVKEINQKVVIIHDNPDDYRSQPSGDSGEKIACGNIVNFN